MSAKSNLITDGAVVIMQKGTVQLVTVQFFDGFNDSYLFFYVELFISVSHFLSSASVLSLYIYCLFLTIVCVYLIICLGVYFFMANERFSFFLQSNVFRCWSSCRAMG